MAEIKEPIDNEEVDIDEEMSDEEFDGWMTIGKEFSDDSSRSDDTMQKMLIMTKISQAHLDKGIVDKNIGTITDLIKENMQDLVGKHFKVVYIDSDNDLALYANVLCRKGNIALIGAR